VISFPEAVRIFVDIFPAVGRKSADASRPKSTCSADPFSIADGGTLPDGVFTIAEDVHSVVTLVEKYDILSSLFIIIEAGAVPNTNDPKTIRLVILRAQNAMMLFLKIFITSISYPIFTRKAKL
jgi:hypothetical protein